MPKLEEDHATFVVNGIDHALPAFRHFVRVDPRRLVPAIGLLGNRGGLGDEQPRRTALRIVFGHQPVGNAFGPGPGAGHRSQSDAVRQFQVV